MHCIQDTGDDDGHNTTSALEATMNESVIDSVDGSRSRYVVTCSAVCLSRGVQCVYHVTLSATVILTKCIIIISQATKFAMKCHGTTLACILYNLN